MSSARQVVKISFPMLDMRVAYWFKHSLFLRANTYPLRHVKALHTHGSVALDLARSFLTSLLTADLSERSFTDFWLVNSIYFASWGWQVCGTWLFCKQPGSFIMTSFIGFLTWFTSIDFFIMVYSIDFLTWFTPTDDFLTWFTPTELESVGVNQLTPTDDFLTWFTPHVLHLYCLQLDVWRFRFNTPRAYTYLLRHVKALHMHSSIAFSIGQESFYFTSKARRLFLMSIEWQSRKTYKQHNIHFSMKAKVRRTL